MANKYDDDEDYELEEDIEEEEEDVEPLPITKKNKPKIINDDGEIEEDDADDLDDDGSDDLDDDIDDIDNEEDLEELIQDDNGIENPQQTLKNSFTHFDEIDDDEDDEDDDIDENYLQKFDENLQKNIISEFHPELHSRNYDEIDVLARVVRDPNGVIIDPLHKTLPFITRYEKARILGERAKQINSGAKPFVFVEPEIIDGYLIALKEFEEKKIPFILSRPLPNGGVEYWRFSDLEILS